MRDGTIADFMRRDFLSVTPATPMREAVARLVETQSSVAPVVDDEGHLLGILSQKDCFAAALNSAYYQRWSDSVARYMSENVEVMDKALDIVSAAERFQAMPYRAFPVLSEGILVGMLSRSDLLKAFLDLG
ncbi:CBS domain-containing protein [Pseudooceanicola sp. HF7]|uniref:CBS domain-containing protein n=1 Tax=Pseudooceanicola sp. HF7 TaxID=2721560 RepID=UPI001430E1E1|nr:CBS domain-containing protein [Pseudooceanicola sp. HF7]NIZ07966.1 CBS domain-containing protein [Pseudooceanicola sp. HF7]